MNKPASPAAAEASTLLTPAQVAKAALRRLALAKLEPTPENYARAYSEESGQSTRPVLPERALSLLDRIAAIPVRDDAARVVLRQAYAGGQWSRVEQLLERVGDVEAEQSRQFAGLIEKLVRGLERSDRQWTVARKKESVHTVVEGSRSDAQRLQRRLLQLVSSWDGEAVEPEANESEAPLAAEVPAAGTMPAPSVAGTLQATPSPTPGPADAQAIPSSDASSLGGSAEVVDVQAWHQLTGSFALALSRALPADERDAARTQAAIQTLVDNLAQQPLGEAMREAAREHAGEAERILRRREQLLQQTHRLCLELADGLTDLAEDDSWARGQCEAMRQQIAEDPGVRSVRSASALLHHTRQRQRELRIERLKARDALKSMIHQMLQEVGELGMQTGRFHDNVGRYADVIESADSLESLAGAVREMVAESRTVQGLVGAAQQRLQDEHTRATALSAQVQTLENELRRLSDEVSTDQLTQIANRRGLIRAFEAERSRVDRAGGPLALALLDVDDFKKLNDTLGHGAGDEALKSLAARVSAALRPTDTVARYGGEEFVVMLPSTAVDEAQQVLTRMQRAMTQALFMHESNPVFVTFSAGVTLHREGESMEAALERADEGLYEAKRTGKNRVCIT